MMNLEQIKTAITAAIAGCHLQVVANESPSAQHSLLVDADHAVQVAMLLRDDPQFRLDYCSNVTGVDWPEIEITQKAMVSRTIDGVEQQVEEVRKVKARGYLEAVYHLYSMELKHGPVILRMRTQDRADGVHLPSLTGVWRSANLQEREIFDLYGIVFDGHPDLRRLLMWDGFRDHPMRKDYVEPDDYEYEPTAHDRVLEKAKRHEGRQ